MFVDYVKKCGLFSVFQYVFSSFRLTAALLAALVDIIANAFNKSGAD